MNKFDKILAFLGK